jgi:hypothetical protein
MPGPKSRQDKVGLNLKCVYAKLGVCIGAYGGAPLTTTPSEPPAAPAGSAVADRRPEWMDGSQEGRLLGTDTRGWPRRQ